MAHPLLTLPTYREGFPLTEQERRLSHQIEMIIERVMMGKINGGLLWPQNPLCLVFRARDGW